MRTKKKERKKSMPSLSKSGGQMEKKLLSLLSQFVSVSLSFSFADERKTTQRTLPQVKQRTGMIMASLRERKKRTKPNEEKQNKKKECLSESVGKLDRPFFFSLAIRTAFFFPLRPEEKEKKKARRGRKRPATSVLISSFEVRTADIVIPCRARKRTREVAERKRSFERRFFFSFSPSSSSSSSSIVFT